MLLENTLWEEHAFWPCGKQKTYSHYTVTALSMMWTPTISSVLLSNTKYFKLNAIMLLYNSLPFIFDSSMSGNCLEKKIKHPLIQPVFPK